MKTLSLLVLLTLLPLTGCTEAVLTQVKDASNKRDTICSFVDVWSGDRAELEEVKNLCDAGADLKEIAAAYAGCSVE